MIVWSRLLEAIDGEGRVAMVTIVATQGSAPRDAGARMVIRADGGFHGTIGGGALEWRAIAQAQAMLGREGGASEVRRFALGPELGQCCGGQVDLLFERFTAADRDRVAEFARLEAAGPFTTAARVAVPAPVERQVNRETSTPGEARLSGGMLVEGFGDERRPLLLFGAGHVGKALVLALAPLPVRVLWIDSRADAYPAYHPQNTELCRLDNPVEALASAAPDSFVLVMTHSHQLDLAIVSAALASGRFPYVGLIGSASKRARFEKRLREAGIDADRIAGLVCPIGVPGIDSKLPAVIAAATVAQILSVDEALRKRGEGEPAASRDLDRRLG